MAEIPGEYVIAVKEGGVLVGYVARDGSVVYSKEIARGVRCFTLLEAADEEKRLRAANASGRFGALHYRAVARF